MTPILRYFYAFMIWSSGLELALARHGGNMALVAERSERLRYWELEAWKFEQEGLDAAGGQSRSME